MRASSMPRRRGRRITGAEVSGVFACATVGPALVMSGTYPISRSCDLRVSAPARFAAGDVDVVGRAPRPGAVREEVPEVVALDALARGLAEDGDHVALVGHPDHLAAAVRRTAQKQRARGDDAPREPVVVVAAAPLAEAGVTVSVTPFVVR